MWQIDIARVQLVWGSHASMIKWDSFTFAHEQTEGLFSIQFPCTLDFNQLPNYTPKGVSFTLHILLTSA